MLRDELSGLDLKTFPMISRRNKNAGYKILIFALLPAACFYLIIGLFLSGIIIPFILYALSVVIFKIYYDAKKPKPTLSQ